MPATIPEEGSHQSIRKQPKNPCFIFPCFFKKQDEPIAFDFILRVLIRKSGVMIWSLLLKRRPATTWQQFNKKNGR
jgi:hypothetical protein